MITKKIVIGSNEERIIPFIWVNGEESEVFYDVELKEEGASVHLVGIFLGTGHKALVFNTNVFHRAPNTLSRTTLRGVFQEYASFKNDGMVRINKGAKNADGYFASKILLFDDAKGRSVPSLEIDENELKAGHASTVGRPDEEQMFYLRSRGLSEKEAEQLIISGFFQPAINLLPLDQQEDVRKKIESVLVLE